MKKKLTVLVLLLLAAAGGGAWWLLRGEWPAADVPHVNDPPVLRGTLAQASANFSFCQRWDPAAGMRLLLDVTQSPARVELTLAPGHSMVARRATPDVPPAELSGAVFYPAAMPTTLLGHAAVVLKARPELWTVCVEDRTVAVFPPPFTVLPVLLSCPTSQVPSPAYLKTRLQKWGDFTFHDDFMPPEGPDSALAQWERLAGAWRLHSAADTVKELHDDKRERGLPTAERSANYYTVRGRGTNALLVTGYDFYDLYDVAAAVNTAPGTMGLAFHVQDASNYHAYVIQIVTNRPDARLDLWRVRNGERKVLAAVTTPLTTEQWVTLRVRTFPERVEASLDNVKVMDVPLSLPAGGRFGLYMDGGHGALFDDVEARSNHDLDFAGLAGLPRYVRAEEGAVLPRPRLFGWRPAAPLTDTLQVTAAPKPRWLALGAPAHGPHVFAATFAARGAAAEVGLLAGWTATNAPVYRFIRHCAPTNEWLRLEYAAPTGTVVVTQLRLPPADAAAPVTLMADATSPGELRLYRNAELVLVHHPADPVGGASGLYVGAGTAAAITAPAYRFAREALHVNRFEKNTVFVDDPYMRHWSSPEGQWIRYPNGAAWHTGDFFGRFLVRLPCLAGTEVHLGVPEGVSNGTWVVRVSEQALSLHAGAATNASATVPLAQLAPRDPKQPRRFTLHYEGRWLWATADGRVLFKQPVAPLAGARLRLQGFTYDQLKDSLVERYQVVDHLFNESLKDWTINGGRWEVVNRYQCDPRWSLMNGESGEGLAAIWTKYAFAGDFCIELHGAMRHEWYERCGDLNITILNRDTTPSQGYTVTCTGWDPDHSQLFTRLYREGKTEVECDRYMMPRIREGNRRGGYMPLVQDLSNADVHRAWYYIKLRRQGQKLEYWYDNELAFTWNDPAPLGPGSAGLWTFMNSIMVARFSVAAAHIEPRPFVFKPVPPEQLETTPQRADARRLLSATLQANERPLDLCQPECWSVDDPVGQAHLAWHVQAGGARAFSVTTRLGSGPMQAACSLPPVPLTNLAGWHVELARTPRAQFNVHYSIGRLQEGRYTPIRRLFHRVSGSELETQGYTQAGATDVPSSGMAEAADGPWTPVTIWIPTELPTVSLEATNLLVRLEGFGNLQASYVQEGLSGNGPGEAYAVRNLTEIRYGRPRLGFPPNAVAPRGVALLDPATDQPFAGCTDLDAIQRWMQGAPDAGLVQTVVALTTADGTTRNDLWWISPTPVPRITCAWSTNQPDTVALRTLEHYPDRRFVAARVYIGAERPATPRPGDGFTRLVPVPRIDVVPTNLTVTVALERFRQTFDLPGATRPCGAPPVLLRLDGLTPALDTLEGEEEGLFVRENPRAAIETDDGSSDRYFTVGNAGLEERLRCAVRIGQPLANFPIWQFRYRAPPMARVSLRLGDNAAVRLSEALDSTVAVRGTESLRLDHAWHTWLGMVADAVRSTPIPADALQPDTVTIGSIGSPDQTGRHTRWMLDDFVCGPAVSTAAQLACLPVYFSLTPVATVRLALRAGQEPWTDLTPTQRQAVVWTNVPPRTRAAPPIGQAPDGLCHVFIQAVDTAGRASAVTDVPILLDREPPRATAAFQPTANPHCNSNVLRAAVSTGGQSPFDLKRLRCRWNDADTPLHSAGSHYVHALAADTLHINWSLAFREHIEKLADGQAATITLTDIFDGAGNRAPDVQVPVKMDFAADHVAPTLLAVDYPSNVLWCAGWEQAVSRLRAKAGQPARPFRFTGDEPVPLVYASGEEPYYAAKIANKVAYDIWQEFESAPWSLKDYPYLAFRIRRPDLQPGETLRIALVFDLDGERRAAIWLTDPLAESRYVQVANKIEWQSNVWHTVRLDLPASMTARYSREIMDKARVMRLRFRFYGGREGQVVHLGSVFVFAPWRASDRVAFDAFDTSGIGGLQWSYEAGQPGAPSGAGQPTSERGLNPAMLPAAPADARWLTVRQRDRAGNLSYPTRLPVAPPPK